MDENLPPSSTPPPYPPPPSAPPPPLAPPPIISSRQTQPARRGGRGWKILAVVLLILLIFSAAKNFRRFSHDFSRPGRAIQQGEEPLDEIVVENNRAENKIAVIELEGIIMSAPFGRSGVSLVDMIQEQLKAAARDPKVKAVILKVNSPGGEVLASDEIYNSIRDFQTNFHKPVIASMGSLAASGGYYVSAPCRWIVANEMTLTGSIGVIMQGYNFRGLMDKIGIRPDTYKSGKHKDMLGGTRREDEIPDDEREMVDALVKEVYGKFTNIVATGRNEAHKDNKGEGQTLSAEWKDFADGRILSGKQAFDLGMVDELGNFRTAIKRAEDLAHVSKANLIRYEQRFGFGNFLRLFGEAETPVRTLKVDFGLDLPKLQMGRLYFIAPTTLP